MAKTPASPQQGGTSTTKPGSTKQQGQSTDTAPQQGQGPAIRDWASI
jgi:hypothetical protein